MSRITVTRKWPDGDKVEVVVEVDDVQPEDLAVARVNAMEAYREAVDAACGLTLEAGPAIIEEPSDD